MEIWSKKAICEVFGCDRSAKKLKSGPNMVSKIGQPCNQKIEACIAWKVQVVLQVPIFSAHDLDTRLNFSVLLLTCSIWEHFFDRRGRCISMCQTFPNMCTKFHSAQMQPHNQHNKSCALFHWFQSVHFSMHNTQNSHHGTSSKICTLKRIKTRPRKSKSLQSFLTSTGSAKLQHGRQHSNTTIGATGFGFVSTPTTPRFWRQQWWFWQWVHNNEVGAMQNPSTRTTTTPHSSFLSFRCSFSGNTIIMHGAAIPHILGNTTINTIITCCTCCTCNTHCHPPILFRHIQSIRKQQRGVLCNAHWAFSSTWRWCNTSSWRHWGRTSQVNEAAGTEQVQAQQDSTEQWDHTSTSHHEARRRNAPIKQEQNLDDELVNVQPSQSGWRHQVVERQRRPHPMHSTTSQVKLNRQQYQLFGKACFLGCVSTIIVWWRKQRWLWWESKHCWTRHN